MAPASLIIKSNFPDADLWVQRRGSAKTVGEVSKSFSPEAFGIKIVSPNINKGYLYFFLQNAKNQGFFSSRAVGSTNLVSIRISDLKDLLRPFSAITNPDVHAQPDLFEERDTTRFIPWDELPEDELLELPLTAFNFDEIDEMEKEDPELFKVLLDNDDIEGQDERVEKAVEIARERREEWFQHSLEDMFSEYVVDKFQRDIDEIPFDDLFDHAEEKIGESLAAYSEEELDDLLHEPDLYDLKFEENGRCGTYAETHPSPGTVWSMCLESFEDQWPSAAEAALRGHETEENGLHWGLLPSDAEEFASELDSIGIYVHHRSHLRSQEAALLLDPRLDAEDVRVTYYTPYLFWMEIDVEEFLDRVEEIGKGKKKIKRDPTTQNVVWRATASEEGNYVALLGPENLSYEGRMQRHCVGRPKFGYGKRVADRKIDIYSLRKPNTKAVLTVEVALDENEEPLRVEQVKGNSNRLPGFDLGNHTELTKIDEVYEIKKFIEEYLGIDPFSVSDLRPALSVWSKMPTIYGRLQRGVPAAILGPAGRWRRERPPRGNPGIPISPSMQRLAEEQFNKPWGGCWYEDEEGLEENPSLHKPIKHSLDFVPSILGKPFTVSSFYTGMPPILALELDNGTSLFVFKGSTNIWQTSEPLDDGVDDSALSKKFFAFAPAPLSDAPALEEYIRDYYSKIRKRLGPVVGYAGRGNPSVDPEKLKYRILPAYGVSPPPAFLMPSDRGKTPEEVMESSHERQVWAAILDDTEPLFERVFAATVLEDGDTHESVAEIAVSSGMLDEELLVPYHDWLLKYYSPAVLDWDHPEENPSDDSNVYGIRSGTHRRKPKSPSQGEAHDLEQEELDELEDRMIRQGLFDDQAWAHYPINKHGRFYPLPSDHPQTDREKFRVAHPRNEDRSLKEPEDNPSLHKPIPKPGTPTDYRDDYKVFTVDGTFGSQSIPSRIFCLCFNDEEGCWYVPEGGRMVNYTFDTVSDGVDLEELNDVDVITSQFPIPMVSSLERLMRRHYADLDRENPSLHKSLAPKKIITNDQGRKFGVKVKTASGESPVVEFYDMSYPDQFGKEGQFVSRYFLSTLIGPRFSPLSLDGGVPAWTISEDNVQDAVDYAISVTGFDPTTVDPRAGFDSPFWDALADEPDSGA